MHKVLISHGLKGVCGTRWNWCNDEEPVGVHGLVCDSDGCGCKFSFIGVDSLAGATHAVVKEVTHNSFLDMRERVRQAMLDAGWSETSAEEAVVQFDELSLDLDRYRVGWVLVVDRTQKEHWRFLVEGPKGG